jgi:hypothetical protein
MRLKRDLEPLMAHAALDEKLIDSFANMQSRPDSACLDQRFQLHCNHWHHYYYLSSVHIR